MKKSEKLQRLRDKTITNLQGLLNTREPSLTRLPALLGKTNDTGTATVSGKPKWVYVRVGNDKTQTVAYNNRTSHRNGLPVVVGYDPAQPGLFQVLGLRQVYADDDSIGGAAVGRHHESHEWGQTDGDDITYLRIRQLNDLRVYVNDPADMSVNIADGVYIIGESVYYLSPDTVDLTSSIPGVGLMRWVLIAANGSGVYTTNGSTAQVVTLSDIPAPTDPTDWRLAAVLVKYGDTALTDWPDEIRIVDLRFAGARSPSPGGGYLDWANTIIVAKSGGAYSTVQEGITAADYDTHVIVLNGAYAENITYSGTYINLSGMVDSHKSGPYGVYLTGADDTGPILTVSGPALIGNMVANRALSAGAGAFIGIDASSVHYKHITDLKIHIGGGATGRDIFGLKLGSAAATNESSLSRSTLITEDSGSGGATLQLSGAGNIDIEFCEINQADGTGNTALSSTATGSNIWIYQTRIKGDVSITGAGTYYFQDCRIDGDITLAATGATVYLRNTSISGNITIGASDVLVLGPGASQASGGTISNSGGLYHSGFQRHTSGSKTDHYLGSTGNNESSLLKLTPTGTVSSAHRSGVSAYFTDYLNDATNYEVVEMVAWDDGNIGGVVRTGIGGTGTAQKLYLGVGNTILFMTRVNTDNTWYFPEYVDLGDALYVDTIDEHSGGVGVTIEGVLLKDSGLTIPGSFYTTVINESTPDGGVWVDGVHCKDSGINVMGTITVDTINEYTAAAGVTIEGVLLKDNNIDTVGAFTVDTINEHTAAAGVTIEGVLLKDSMVNTSYIEVGASSSGKGSAGLVYVETTATDGAVILSWGGPSYGVTLRNHLTATGWARGFGLQNTGATETYIQYGAFGSGQTFSYGYIGPDYSNTHMRFYKSAATTPQTVGFTNVTLSLTPSGGTTNYPFYIRTVGVPATAFQYHGIYINQEYTGNDQTMYAYYARYAYSNASQIGRAFYLHVATGYSYAGMYGFQVSNDGQIGASGFYGVSVAIDSGGDVVSSGDFVGLHVTSHASSTVGGNSFGLNVDFNGSTTGSAYGFYVDGENYNYVSGYVGLGNTDWNAKLGIGTGGASWTTSNWGRAIQIQAGTVMKWKLSGTYAYGMGVTGSPSSHYFFSSTADDNSAAPTYWMTYSASSGIVVINALVRGNGTSGHFQVETDYGTSQYGMLNSSYCHLYTDASTGFYFQKSITVSGPINAYGTTKTNDIGTSALAWDDVWADDFQNVADFFYADEHAGKPINDLEALSQIKPSGKRDPRTGMLLIDDDTIPEFMLTRTKDGGKILYDPDGAPYISFKMFISVVMGAVRLLGKDNKDQWEVINQLLKEREVQ